MERRLTAMCGDDFPSESINAMYTGCLAFGLAVAAAPGAHEQRKSAPNSARHAEITLYDLLTRIRYVQAGSPEEGLLACRRMPIRRTNLRDSGHSGLAHAFGHIKRRSQWALMMSAGTW